MSLQSDHQRHDLFASFPELETRLYYNEFYPEARVIRLADMISHFAALIYTPEEIAKECIVARSLDRVSV